MNLANLSAKLVAPRSGDQRENRFVGKRIEPHYTGGIAPAKSTRFGLLVAGQRGAGHGLPGNSHSNLDSLARRQNHHLPVSGWSEGNHG